jgi:hypothetical protein
MVRPGSLGTGATTVTPFIKKICISFVVTFAVLNGAHAAFVYGHLFSKGAHIVGKVVADGGRKLWRGVLDHRPNRSPSA